MLHFILPKTGPIFLSTLTNEELDTPYNLKDRKQKVK